MPTVLFFSARVVYTGSVGAQPRFDLMYADDLAEPVWMCYRRKDKASAFVRIARIACNELENPSPSKFDQSHE